MIILPTIAADPLRDHVPALRLLAGATPAKRNVFPQLPDIYPWDRECAC